MRRHLILRCIFALFTVTASTAPLLAAASSSPAASSPSQWSVSDVVNWFTHLGLSSYTTAIERELIDGEVLFTLTMDEWREYIGIDKIGTRKKLEKALKELKEMEESGTAPTVASATGSDATKKDAESVPQKPEQNAEPTSDDKSTEKPAAASSSSSNSEPPKPPKKKPSPPPSKPQQQQPPTPPQSQPPANQKRFERINALLSQHADVLIGTNETPRVPSARSLSSNEEVQLSEALRVGLAHHQRGEFVQAKKHYERALQLQPRNARAMHMLGLIHMAQNDDAAANSLLLSSIHVSPESDTFLNLGNLYSSQQRLPQAIASWTKALDLGPLSGGPALRERFTHVLYSEALRLHGIGEVKTCEAYLKMIVNLITEGLLLHFPPDRAGHMDENETRKVEQMIANVGGPPPVVDKQYSFLTSSASQLFLKSAELTHSFRMMLADTWLHLGMLQSSQDPALAAAYYQRVLQVKEDYLDPTKPKEVRIATIHEEARAYKDKLTASGITITKQQAKKSRKTVMMQQYALMPSPDFAKTRSKKLVEALHKSCKTREAFELSQYLQDDVVFQSPRYSHLYEDNEEIDETRDIFEGHLDLLLTQSKYVNIFAGGNGLEWCRFRFYLAYHGRNNAQILKKLAQSYERMTTVLQYTSPHLIGSPLNGLEHRVRRPAGANGELSTRGKIKIAFISAFLNHHPVGKTVQGYIFHLPRDRFEIIVYFITLQPTDFEAGGDHVYNDIKKSANIFRTIPPEAWMTARTTIERDRPDILIYPDIGMEPTTYFLAFSRLAPIQAMTFGHPDTSGIKNIDYFLSHDEMEVENVEKAQENYSERLVRLPGVGYWHPALLPTSNLDRTYFGLSDADLRKAGVVFPAPSIAARSSASPADTTTVYLVTKSVQFFSPTFLDLLAGILFKHTRSILAIVMETGRNTKGYDAHNVCGERILEGIEKRLRHMKAQELDEEGTSQIEEEFDAADRKDRHPAYNTDQDPFANDVLGQLLSTTAPPHLRAPISGRVRFIDRGDHEYFMNLLRVSDVLLQPTPLDGTTTTLEAVTMATPTVVYESETIGGRMAYAIYRHMGITDTIARTPEEYIDIAVRLGTDAEFAKSVRDQLVAAAQSTDPSNRIFEDPNAIDAYAEWIETATAELVAQSMN